MRPRTGRAPRTTRGRRPVVLSTASSAENQRSTIAGVVDTANIHTQRSVPPGFQPAGRAPAPAPLDLVQDFVNSEIPVWAVDDIATPELLGDWLRARRLASGATVVDPASFVRARAVRTLLRELAKRNTRGVEPETELREELNAVTAELRVRFALDEHGVLRVEAVDDTVDAALGVILAAVQQSQVVGIWRRLKSCPGPHCGWLFYDSSRNASSRWCSMSICGNRTKTAAYRRRRKDGS